VFGNKDVILRSPEGDVRISLLNDPHGSLRSLDAPAIAVVASAKGGHGGMTYSFYILCSPVLEAEVRQFLNNKILTFADENNLAL